jgi:Xaa-Pro aminopeptidase
VLIAHNGSRRSVLFCREKNAEREIWDGFRYGPEEARDTFGFDESLPIERLDERIPALLIDCPALFYHLGAGPEFDSRVHRWLGQTRALARSGRQAPTAAHDLAAIVDEMRLVKDAGEIATMRRAARISAAAHLRAMRACRIGMREYEVEAELLHEFRRQGAQSPAYPAVVAAGATPACCATRPAMRN